jgi:hypothetical protein
MAVKDFVTFYSAYLPQHGALQAELDRIADSSARIVAMVAAGQKAGFTFTAGEAEEGLRTLAEKTRETDRELTDEKLDSVSGGIQMAMQRENRSERDGT